MADSIQAQIDALNTAIATGALELRQGQETVRYRSVDEMLRVVARLERQQGKARSAALTPTYSKGV